VVEFTLRTASAPESTLQTPPAAERIVALGALCAGAIACHAYRRAIRAARARVSTGSRIARIRWGRIEYADAGCGRAALVVHGAGGGFDQGMQFAAPLAQPGLRVIAMSRFGHLRTPLPADASPAAQADAHAALLDALQIDRAAVIGMSAT
jgi:2-hydroxy-6-oxonona-2,4-dienedioate hydrolase